MKIAKILAMACLCAGHPVVNCHFFGRGLTIPLDPPSHRHEHMSARQRENLLALTIWAEGRSGGSDGMHAVANVIMNRVRVTHKSVERIVLPRWQFSCWLPTKDGQLKAMKAIKHLDHHSPDYIMWIQARGLAHMAIHHRLRDWTDGATMYKVKGLHVKWNMKKLRWTVRLGGQDFYAERK